MCVCVCVYSFYYFLVFFLPVRPHRAPLHGLLPITRPIVICTYIYYMSKPFHARLVVVQRNYIIHARHIHMPTILPISRIILLYIIYS